MAERVFVSEIRLMCRSPQKPELIGDEAHNLPHGHSSDRVAVFAQMVGKVCSTRQPEVPFQDPEPIFTTKKNVTFQAEIEFWHPHDEAEEEPKRSVYFPFLNQRREAASEQNKQPLVL